MAREVWLVSGDKKLKAEDLLKKDDLVMRQSIAIKEASTLGINEKGFFFIIEGSHEAIKRAEELLKDVGKRYEHKDRVLKAYDELEEAAISGFGAILGG